MLAKKGLNPLEIKTEKNMIEAQVKGLKEKGREAKTKEEREEYMEKAETLMRNYEENQEKIFINMGAEMADCIIECLGIGIKERKH